MIKKLSLLLIIIFSFSMVYAQVENIYKGRFYIAPDFGLMLGTINRIEVSPVLGYYFTERLNLAAGFKYEFYSNTRLYSYQQQVKTHIYGPRAFARYSIIKDLGEFLPIGANTAVFAHAEFESNSLENKYFAYPTFPGSGRFWYSTLLVGGGISQYASERVQLNIQLLWDTDGSSISIYSNPIIRFGLQFFIGPKPQDY